MNTITKVNVYGKVVANFYPLNRHMPCPGNGVPVGSEFCSLMAKSKSAIKDYLVGATVLVLRNSQTEASPHVVCCVADIVDGVPNRCPAALCVGLAAGACRRFCFCVFSFALPCPALSSSLPRPQLHANV